MVQLRHVPCHNPWRSRGGIKFSISRSDGVCWLRVGLAVFSSAESYLGVSAFSEDRDTATGPRFVHLPCKREIYERYRSTPMANASGPATEGLMPADFRHAPSGVHYKVFEQRSQVW